MKTRPNLLLFKHHHTDLKWTILCLGPIQTRLEAFLGFLGKTKMKAYTKLTVVMCSQIIDRKSVAIYSGERRSGRLVDNIRNFDKKKLVVKNISISSVFFCFQHTFYNKNIMETCGLQEKVASRPKRNLSRSKIKKKKLVQFCMSFFFLEKT